LKDVTHCHTMLPRMPIEEKMDVVEDKKGKKA
jgi:hypothetical protein